MAEYYSAELSQKVKRGMNETRQKGNFTGGYVLFGYRVENKKLIIEENEAEIVRWMFSECVNGKFVKNIRDELNDKGILCRGKPFAKNTVYRILANEKYIGIFRHKDEVFTNMYPPIVSQEIFNIVKDKIENNKYGKHKPDIVYLLRNKVRCGCCGKPINSDSGTSKSGNIIRYYKCSGRRTSIKCHLKPIRKETLESLVLDTVTEAFATPHNLLYLADNIMILMKKQYNDHSTLNLLKSDLTKVDKAISNILDCMEQGLLSHSTKKRLEELEEKQSMLKEKILIEENKEKHMLTKEDVIKHISSALRKSGKQLVDLLVKEIIVYDDKIDIYLHFVDKKSPDDNNRWDFCFYECEKSYIVCAHTFKPQPVKYFKKI